MPKEPRSYEELILDLKKFLPHIHSGKVRDSFRLPHVRGVEKLRLVLVSDRVSIFDFRLGFPIPGKGEILNAFNIAARLLLRRDLQDVEDDMVAYGQSLAGYLPDYFEFDTMLQKRAIIVRDLPMVKVECIVRGNLTGSGYASYKRDEPVSGHSFEPTYDRNNTRLWLSNGALLEPPLFTPSTKAEDGEHDLPIDYRQVEDEYPGLGEAALQVFNTLKYAALRGDITLADSKFEFGYKQLAVPRRREWILADEVMTSDSSRFWDGSYPDLSDGPPPSMDKQILRNWGIKQGIDSLDSSSEADQLEVSRMVPPQEVIDGMQQQVHTVFRRLHGMSLAEFQKDVMLVK